MARDVHGLSGQLFALLATSDAFAGFAARVDPDVDDVYGPGEQAIAGVLIRTLAATQICREPKFAAINEAQRLEMNRRRTEVTPQA